VHIIRADIHFGGNARGGVVIASPLLRMIAFIFGSVVLVAVFSVLLYLGYIASALFVSLILWRGMDVNSARELHEKLQAATTVLGELVGLPKLLPWLFYPLVFVLNYIGTVKLSYSQVIVTCEGAQAPLELVGNMVILGVVIMFIIAGYQFLWANHIAEMHSTLVRKYCSPSAGACRVRLATWARLF
jgi:hypothetical protein